ncbi:MAG: hypothetical protein HGA87_02945 [Desulfobulbaceae bacterium]|nr:hypothetical protein [Desulfobulbaceae bacterium]
MEESARFDNILKLGKRLVEELGLDQSVDTLGRWMAHYIAELIHDAETAIEEDQDEKRSQCASAILDLWDHHSTMPRGRRPFQDFEAILRALESLDPKNAESRYYWPVRNEAAKEQMNAETAAWLGIADGVDHTARLLVRYCLACAAQDAADKSMAWVTLAEAAGTTDLGYLPIIRVISNEVALTDEEVANDKDRKELVNRLKRLEEFADLAQNLSDRLRAKLDITDNDTMSSV